MVRDANNCTKIGVIYRWHRVSVVLCLGLLLVPQFAPASAATLYGQDYFRVEHGDATATPKAAPKAEPKAGLPPAGVKPGETGREEYLGALQDMERANGPYSDALAEPLAGLGNYAREQGDYRQALGFYLRALHVIRVNDGLYSERQLPLVRDLLNTYRLVGDIEALDERYEYFFRLYGGGQPPFTELRLKAALEFLRWQREAVHLDLDGNSVNRLLEMYRINQRVLDAASQSTQVTPYWFRQLVMSQVRNLYLLQSEFELPDEVHLSGYGSALPSNSRADLDFNLQRLEALRRTSVAKGRKLLEELVARSAASGDAEIIAGAHLELGDWHQWNGSLGNADREYSKVIDILDVAGHSELLENWLGSPIELPASGAFWQSQRTGAKGRWVTLAAQYAVSSKGYARDIQVSAATPDEELFAASLRRKLKATRFRPRFVTGRAESVRGVMRHYELLTD